MAEVGEVLARRGGSATFSDLLAVVTAHAIRAALAAGTIRRVAKGVYALPEAPPAIDDVTTPVRTVLDCARTLPLHEALAVTDSALRLGLVDQDELVNEAARLAGPYRRRIQRVVGLADRRAESVLESALRAILIDAGIGGFEPQVAVHDTDFSARLDLGHRRRRIGLEADGFEHHGSRTALVKDCRRQVNLSLRGWLVLRFSWEDVMYDPDWVADAVRAALRHPPLINQLPMAA